MDLNYTEPVERFAGEVRDFIRAELPAETREKVLHHQRLEPEEQIAWQRKLCDQGWACPSWPKEYGGPGWDAMQRHIYGCVTAEEGAPAAIPFGETMIAPVLMGVGSDAQKAHYLPRIRTLEHWFCQGFSEPGAGSDLASLKTRAERDGDDWVINGQKTWTSIAHHANMMFCLVRTETTEKRQEGITMMVFPMSLPGITVRPIITMDGGHTVNEVFFDDVRVAHDGVIGEPGKGWTYAKLLLGHERTSIARIGLSKRELRRLKTLAAEAPGLGAQTSREIAALEIELLALEITALRIVSADGAGEHGVEANLLKIKGSEIQQRLTELLMDVAGPTALPFDPGRGLDLGNEAPFGPEGVASFGPNYLITRVVSIYGGSNEIQRNIIAKTLGL